MRWRCALREIREVCELIVRLTSETDAIKAKIWSFAIDDPDLRSILGLHLANMYFIPERVAECLAALRDDPLTPSDVGVDSFFSPSYAAAWKRFVEFHTEDAALEDLARECAIVVRRCEDMDKKMESALECSSTSDYSSSESTCSESC